MAIIGNVGVQFTGDHSAYTATTESMKKASRELVKEFDESSREFAATNRRLREEVLTEAERTAAKLKELDQAFGAGGIDAETYKRQLLKMKDANDGFYGSLKQLGGSGGNLKDVLNIARGAGAVAGVTLVARKVEQITGNAVELRKEWAAGNIEIYDMADGLAKSVPILGDMYGVFKNIRELLTGEDAITASILRAAALQDAVTKVATDLRKGWADWQAEAEKAMEAVERRMRGMGMAPENAAAENDRNNAEDQVKQILKDAKERRAAQFKEIVDQEREAREIQRRLEVETDGLTPNQMANLGMAEQAKQYEEATRQLERLQKSRERLQAQQPLWDAETQKQIDAARAQAELNIVERAEKARQEALQRGVEERERVEREYWDGLMKRNKEFEEEVKKGIERKREEEKKAVEDALKDEKRRREELAREADQVRRENQTPAERAAEELQRLKGLRASGALDEESFRRARRRLERGLEEGGNQTFSAEERREAFAVPEQQDETGKDLLDNAEKQLDTMGEILKVLGTRTAVLIA